MLNKYQEALDNLKNLAKYRDKYVTSNEFLEQDFKDLHELVDKATPIKPILKNPLDLTDEQCKVNNISWKFYHCPVCNMSTGITNKQPIYYKPKYCRDCSQALDWSDTNE